MNCERRIVKEVKIQTIKKNTGFFCSNSSAQKYVIFMKQWQCVRKMLYFCRQNSRKMENTSIARAVVVMLVTVVVMAGCRGSAAVKQEDSPSGVVTAFDEAILAKDYRGALLMTDTEEDDYELYEAWLRMMFDEMEGSRLVVLGAELTEDGKEASVRVKLDSEGSTDTLYTHTVKTDGGWKVRLVSNF